MFLPYFAYAILLLSPIFTTAVDGAVIASFMTYKMVSACELSMLQQNFLELMYWLRLRACLR